MTSRKPPGNTPDVPEELAKPIEPRTAAQRLVFVYGTLRRGQRNDITRLRPTPRFVGAATTAGLMVHLGAYPGVMLRLQAGVQAPIQGEVYAIEPALERRLDEIEMIDPLAPDDENGEYIRREIEVDVDGARLVCLFYEINPGFALGKPVIASGDWVLGNPRQ